MKALLVPTDFSETSQHAAVYAMQLAKQLGIAKIVLYHAFQLPLTVDPMVPAIQILDEEQLRKTSMSSLENLKNQLRNSHQGTCEIEVVCEYGILSNGLDEVAHAKDCGIIVMGVSGGGPIQENLIGSNTVSVAKQGNVPVIIVSKTAHFQKIERILLLVDDAKLTSAAAPKAVIDLVANTKATLLVFHAEADEHFIEQVNEQVNLERIQLVVTMPKKHGFFESLFTTSHTTKLAFHSQAPILAVH